MNHKFLTVILFITVLTLTSVSPVMAISLPTLRQVATPSAIATSPGKLIKAPVLTLLKITVFKGNVEAIGSNYLTVGGKRVNFDSKTKFFRKFGGKAEVLEFSIGDGVQVVGLWTSEAKAEVNARLIRNFSIQKRYGVFIGTIKSLKPETGELVLTTLRRGNQEVMPDKNTKYVDRDIHVLSFDKLRVGDRIRVKGTWDSKLNQIFGVIQVKDYSIPAKPATASPSTQE